MLSLNYTCVLAKYLADPRRTSAEWTVPLKRG